MKILHEFLDILIEHINENYDHDIQVAELLGASKIGREWMLFMRFFTKNNQYCDAKIWYFITCSPAEFAFEYLADETPTRKTSIMMERALEFTKDANFYRWNPANDEIIMHVLDTNN